MTIPRPHGPSLLVSRVAVLLLALLLGIPASVDTVQAQATTFTVNSTNDVDDGTCDATHWWRLRRQRQKRQQQR
jgi:hypothetical protein